MAAGSTRPIRKTDESAHVIQLLADENFNNRIVRGVLRKNPDIKIVRAQDTEMYQAPDSNLLAWAAEHGFILLTHDADTIPGFAKNVLPPNFP